jgi:hypothetical protein
MTTGLKAHPSGWILAFPNTDPCSTLMADVGSAYQH